jgi:hypothetical protein
MVVARCPLAAKRDVKNIYFFGKGSKRDCRVAAICSRWEESVSALAKRVVVLFSRTGKGSLKRWIPEEGGRWAKKGIGMGLR